jgi:hypothetical protein
MLAKTLRKSILTQILCLFALSAAVILSVSCGGSGDAGPTPSPSEPANTAAPGAADCDSGAGDPAANLLANPGFENGEDPWITLVEASGFEVTSERVHSGTGAAHLQMRDSAEETGTNGAKVYYLVQEITPDKLPEVVCGYYFAENWLKGSPHQYVQFVIIALGPSNLPTTYSNYQLRYILAGTDSPPFDIDNAKFVFVTRTTQPTLNEWVPFELPVTADFQRLWGAVPEGFEKLRLLFEVRWDNKVAGASPAEADVYYDDLYAGPGG